jgi:prepilin-type N-terminal cleavage/methylation domain-containing protein
MRDTSYRFIGFGKMKRKAFSLVEIILVVTILGILAAIVLPSFQNHVTSAKESAVKGNLLTIRSQLEVYKLQHSGVPPGYVDGAGAPTATFVLQLTATSTATGAVSTSTAPVDPYLYGPYLKKIPENPYNGLSTIAYVSEGTDFSSAADGTSSGWLYKKETSEFKVNWTGTDSNGLAFYSY